MVKFAATILRFAKQGEKTGWTYIEIPAKVAEKLKPGFRKSYRVKGSLDDHPINWVALLPMGEGSFIMPMNAGMRKGTRKKQGDKIRVTLEEDKKAFQPPKWFMECLSDEPEARKFFLTLSKGHQNYFIKWIESAKTEPTRTKRTAQAVNAFSKHMGFPEMLRAIKAERDELGF